MICSRMVRWRCHSIEYGSIFLDPSTSTICLRISFLETTWSSRRIQYATTRNIFYTAFDGPSYLQASLAVQGCGSKVSLGLRAHCGLSQWASETRNENVTVNGLPYRDTVRLLLLISFQLTTDNELILLPYQWSVAIALTGGGLNRGTCRLSCLKHWSKTLSRSHLKRQTNHLADCK